MAGTDKSRGAVAFAPGAGPAVVLVAPQLGQNIGMVARAMLNCGLRDMRLVSPRDGWPSRAALAAAAGAGEVLARASLFERTAQAVADLNLVYATTARPRGLAKPVLSPRTAAAEMRASVADGAAVGLLFGPERSGLANDDLVLADRLVEVPLNPAFASLNLAQAVLLVGYEWYQTGEGPPPGQPPSGDALPAEKAELMNFFERLEAGLDAGGFFHPPEKRQGMIRNLRTLFQRARPSQAELRTLHGVVSALMKAKRRE